MATKVDLDIPYSVKLLDRNGWVQGELALLLHGKRDGLVHTWLQNGHWTGAGIYSAQP